MTERIFVSAPLPGGAIDRLRAVAEVTVGMSGLGVTDALFTEQIATYDALVTLLTDRVDARLVGRASRLRVVANVAVGVDNVDLVACGTRGVIVTNTPGVLTDATADYAFGLLLAAARRIIEGDRFVRNGAFTGWSPTMLLGAPVHGATLGIVGMGRIGQAMARRARGFGMHVLYTQRTRLAPELERALSARHVSIDALVRQSDFVSLHCPLTDETRHIINAERLASMKPGAVLVNTARGPCVDERALVTALETGPLGAAALDVFEAEPDVDPGLLALPNVVLSPHIGSADHATRERMANIAAENVIAVLGGRQAANPVGGS